jgi:ABC-type phosphate/phosphonate transport system substrate-binding protein
LSHLEVGRKRLGGKPGNRKGERFMLKLVALCITAVLLFGQPLASLAADPAIDCWFPSSWKVKGAKAKAITSALTEKSGLSVQPRIAKSYPQILAAFDSESYSLVYVGSFVQTIIRARELGTPLAQGINGKEFYSGIMVYPRGKDPGSILKGSPEKVAFTIGASSGESSAKAATGGKAAVGVANHKAASMAVKAGKAEAAVVKNWWWDGNKGEFPDFEVYRIPGVSEDKNPDNVLTASKSIPPAVAKKIADAALASAEAFGVQKMAPFDIGTLDFSLGLMEKGGIDPLTYSW